MVHLLASKNPVDSFYFVHFFLQNPKPVFQIQFLQWQYNRLPPFLKTIYPSLVASLLASAGVRVVAARHAAPTPAGLPAVPLDLTSPASLTAALEQAKPEAVLHCAALSDPDRCQQDPALTRALNVEAAARLARWCHRRGVRLVALSTDLVFPGDRPYSRETDAAGPLLLYAQSKLEGEQVLLAEAPEGAVARVALVHGRGFGSRATASEAIAWRLRAGQAVRLFTDQYRTPGGAESLDWKTGEAIMGLVQDLHFRRGLSSIVVTHNEKIAAFCRKVYVMEDGRLKRI